MAEELRFIVDAEVCAADGGSDGAYDLLTPDEGSTAEEIAANLLSVLRHSIESQLTNGARGPGCGDVLRITITDWARHKV
jgi:hypothetical protein